MNAVIASLLDQLAAVRKEKVEVEAKIKASIPAELAERLACLVESDEELDDTIKDKAKFIPLTQAHTLVGAVLQLVWYVPSPKLSEDKVEALLKTLGVEGDKLEASLENCREYPDPYWAIRKRAKDKVGKKAK